MAPFSSQDYGSIVAELLADAPLNDLGPGHARESHRAKLAALSPAELVSPRPLRNREMGLACLAGLWLRWDFLTESHELSQQLETVEGSYWHAIMHRREPDYENAKYWFRRVGQHPIFPALAAAGGSSAPNQADRGPAYNVNLDKSHWDPFAFVDACRVAAGGRGDAKRCQQLQQREWELLFDYCFQQA